MKLEMKSLVQCMLAALDQLLLTHDLFYESESLSSRISRCNLEPAYSLEIIDQIDPGNNHVVIVSNSLLGLFEAIPLNIANFAPVPQIFTSDACEEMLRNNIESALEEF